MPEKATVVLKTPDGEDIVCDVRSPSRHERLPAVVMFHSFMAFKDWGWFPLAAERIAEAGFVSVICNFSRNGVKENPSRITDFEAFQNNTISRELVDARMVLDSVAKGRIGNGRIDPARLALLGHSRGGGIAIITASQSQNVKGLVTWSSVATFDRWTGHQKEQWRKLGYLPLSRDTAASPLRLGLGLLEDVERNRETLDLLKAAARVRKPWLILHGHEDVLVRFSEAEQLYGAADRSTTELLPLEHTGHTYGGAEVRVDSRIHDVIARTIDWLRPRL